MSLASPRRRRGRAAWARRRRPPIVPPAGGRGCRPPALRTSQDAGRPARSRRATRGRPWDQEAAARRRRGAGASSPRRVARRRPGGRGGSSRRGRRRRQGWERAFRQPFQPRDSDDAHVVEEGRDADTMDEKAAYGDQPLPPRRAPGPFRTQRGGLVTRFLEEGEGIAQVVTRHGRVLRGWPGPEGGSPTGFDLEAHGTHPRAPSDRPKGGRCLPFVTAPLAIPRKGSDFSRCRPEPE